MTSVRLCASGKCGTSSVPSPSSVAMITGRSALAAKVVLPTPATPWIRMRGGVSVVVCRSDAREIAISVPLGELADG